MKSIFFRKHVTVSDEEDLCVFRESPYVVEDMRCQKRFSAPRNV